MKKKNIFLSILMIGLLLFGNILFISCDDGEELSTDQYGTGITLNVFGPSPVARGGELRFIGSNMNQVTAVVIPGCAEITDITVVSNEEIHITVPQDAQPGKVILKTPQGDITTTTLLKFTEPVGFEVNPYSSSRVKAGDKLTISGEYLNLVTGIIFPESVEVDMSNFIDHNRKSISLYVPEEAQSGRLALTFVATGDTIPNMVYAEANLDVVLPSVTTVANLTGKKPGDEISQNGSDLDLVRSLTIAGKEVDFQVNADANVIKYTIPENTPSEATVQMIPASGVEVVIAYIGMSIPTNLKVSPSENLWAGDEIIITGKDLDVVTGVNFPNVSSVVELSEQSATSITVKVPAGTQTGDVILNCKSGATVSVSIKTRKPEFKAYNPTPVAAGNELEIQGNNLDIISSVTFAEGLHVAPVSQTVTSLKVNVPVTAVSGSLKIALSNGESCEFPSLDIDSPVFCFVPELPTEEIKAGGVITLIVVNADKLSNVQIDGEDCQYILSGETLMIGVPESAGPSSQIKLLSTNGEVTYDYAFIPNTQQKRIAWSGLTQLTWSDGGRIMVPVTAFDDVPEGATLTLCYTQVDGQWDQAQINNGNWNTIDFLGTGDGITPISDGKLVPTDVYGWFSDGTLYRETKLLLTADVLENIRANASSGNGLIIQGSGLTFSQIYIEWTISLEVNINGDCVHQGDRSKAWEFPSLLTWNDEGRFRVMRNGPSNIQSLKYKAGKSVMYIYKTGSGQAQINNANWSSLTSAADWNGDLTVLEVVLTQDIIDCLTGVTSDGWSDTALIIQGDGMTISKITILP